MKISKYAQKRTYHRVTLAVMDHASHHQSVQALPAMGYPQQNPDCLESPVVGVVHSKGSPVVVIPGNREAKRMQVSLFDRMQQIRISTDT